VACNDPRDAGRLSAALHDAHARCLRRLLPFGTGFTVAVVPLAYLRAGIPPAAEPASSMALPCFLLYSDFMAGKAITSRPSTSPVETGGLGKQSPAYTGKSAPSRPTTMKAKRVDPAVLDVIKMDAASKPVTVMVKLDSKMSSYARHPVSNRPNSARERAFNAEVDDIVRSVSEGGKAHEGSRIVQSAANLGVATLHAPVSVVKGLLGVAQIAGLKLTKG
jgi:hypothetical protein